ncbi:MAG: redoxin domain-containing protein [Alcanivoracaceae bacterium]|nr:redoxin domain-containing protein [Alcanivoracaceae bacterium]
MNLVKSIFIFLAPVWLIVVVLQGVYAVLNSEDLFYAGGLILSALPLLLFLSYILLFKRLARTSEYLLSVLIPSLLGYLMTLMLFIKHTDYNQMLGMMFALSAFLVTFLYIFWYSNNNRDITGKIKNNLQLPTFMVKDSDGNEIQSTSFAGNKTLIFFYRGNWCPLCMAQIDEVANNYRKFAENNIDVVFIAPQSAKNTKSLAEKHNLSFKFYLDEDNRAAKKLDIVHKFGLPMGFQALGYDSDSVYPTIIAIDENGNIIYSDQTSNYRVRPEPEELFAIFS